MDRNSVIGKRRAALFLFGQTLNLSKNSGGSHIFMADIYNKSDAGGIAHVKWQPDGGMNLQVVVIKSPKFIGGVLRLIFKIKKTEGQ